MMKRRLSVTQLQESQWKVETLVFEQYGQRRLPLDHALLIFINCNGS